MLEKGDRKGPLGPAVPGQDQKGAPNLENYPPSRVGALPIRAPASQCGSYVKKGVSMTNKKGPPFTTNCHDQRNGLRAPFHQDPSMVLQPRNLWCGRTSLQGHYKLAPSVFPH